MAPALLLRWRMSPRHVVVAGAGLAGLSAAHELAAGGARVTLIDARDRAGGRVWTVRDGFADGQHAELGAEFVDDGHEHIRALAKRFDLPLVRVLDGGFLHRVRIPGDGFHVSRSGPWELCDDLLAPLLRRYEAAGGHDAADVVREISTWSLAGWLEHQRASAADLAMARTVRGFFLADPEDLSVLPMVAQLADAGSPARIPVFRIVGGTDRLVDALVAHTPARLLLRHQVRGVEQTDDGIVVRVSDERERLQAIACDAVVMATPASTLREITITPPLPDEQQKAIARLRYGCATKVAVQVADDALRRRRGRAFATDSALGAFWDATEGQPTDARSIIHFLGGGSASARLREKAAHGAAAVLADLCWLGLAGAPIVASHQVSWEDDPFARGGYAYADPGFDPAWKPLLSRRAGNIVFAGEHTSKDHQGYMEGAVESGLRAARELMV